MDVWAFFHRFKRDKRWRRLILAVNLGGIAYGFYYYAPQFETTPWQYWLFVPDSPLAVLWATIALVAYEFEGRRSNVLDGLAFIANVQVGLWTVFVLAYHHTHFGTFVWSDFGAPIPSLNAVLLVLHLGMVAEAMIFVRDIRADFSMNADGWKPVAGTFALLLAWFLVNDYLDYFFEGVRQWGCAGLRPYTVPCDDIGFVAAVTFALSVGSAAVLAAATWPRD